jgi:hypothetical protein
VSTLLLEHLIDDGSLFPPGNAPMVLAVGMHRAVKVGPLGWLVGRFVCPTARVEEAIGELRPGDAFAVALLVNGSQAGGSQANGGPAGSARRGMGGLPAALDRVQADDRLRLLAVEVAVPTGTDLVPAVREKLVALPEHVRCYVELPRVPQWQAALAVIAAARQGAKLRTGGPKAGDFPTEREVGDFISGCVVAGVPFKCSAGLHRAVRHTDRRREHHGFLNIALAVCAAVRRQDPVPILAERDVDTVTTAVRDMDDETAARARALYAGFDSASIPEAAGDLLAMGLLEEAPT